MVYFRENPFVDDLGVPPLMETIPYGFDQNWFLRRETTALIFWNWASYPWQNPVIDQAVVEEEEEEDMEFDLFGWGEAHVNSDIVVSPFFYLRCHLTCT